MTDETTPDPVTPGPQPLAAPAPVSSGDTGAAALDTGTNPPSNPTISGTPIDLGVEDDPVKDPSDFQEASDLTLVERVTQLELLAEWLWDDYEQRKMAAGAVVPDPIRDGIDRWLKRVNARRKKAT